MTKETDKEVKILYKSSKKFQKLFDLMFSEFGWDVTHINEDCLSIYRIFERGEK